MVTRSPPPVSFPITSRPLDRRQIWAATRFWMETENIKSKRFGGKSHHHWYVLLAMTKVFEWGTRAVRLYERGHRNAHAIGLRELDHGFSNLPPAFDGLTLLQLSDLHLDGMPGLEDIVLELLGDRRFDVCVLTGDYRTELHGPIADTMRRMERLISGLQLRYGLLGILGNHDTCHMVPMFEDMGVRMLINESVFLDRGDQHIQFVGTDDVHYYYTDQALHALERAESDAFTIALIHSPEMYDVAARHGVNLYLCGHTHGGQVCLPGGRAVITHLNRGKEFIRGVWSYQGMRGVTHGGTGTSGVPLRFNTRGEVLIHRLRRIAS